MPPTRDDDAQLSTTPDGGGPAGPAPGTAVDTTDHELPETLLDGEDPADVTAEPGTTSDTTPTADPPPHDEPTADADLRAADEPPADLDLPTDEPTADEPTADEPTADEPTADEPTADVDVRTDEPTAGDEQTPEVEAAPDDEPTPEAATPDADAEAAIVQESKTETPTPTPTEAEPEAETAVVPDGAVDAEPDVEPEPEPEPHRTRLLRRLLGDGTLALDTTPRARLVGWLWALGVTVFAGVLRFWNLGHPHRLVFDETYYVKDAWSLLVQGYEGQWGDDPNPAFESGDTSGLNSSPSYVVHPQLGKWLIALGLRLGGGADSAFAWRLGVALAGTIAVLLIARIGRRLFASTALGVVAALLLAVDGEAIVMSRISLLDPFLMVFALAAFGALVLDREQARRRLAERSAAILDAGGELGGGPRLGWRWWRLAAAVLLGLAIGTKWSGIYFLAVFGLMTVAWDITARRAIGARRWLWAGVVKDGIVAGVAMVSIAVVTYVATWSSWLFTADGYLRQWAVQNPGQGVTWLPGPLRSLWKYHQDMWTFHNGLETPHSYAAHPLGWIVQWRPTSFWYPSEVSGLTGQEALDACRATSCSEAIMSIGNPVLWWCGAAAILVAVIWLIRFRDWRAGAVLSGIVAGWAPWFLYAHRTIFTFYSIAFTPWIVLTLTYVLGLVVGPKDEADARARRWATWSCGVLVALVVLVSAFFYPIWAAIPVPYWFWHAHMWLPTWI